MHSTVSAATGSSVDQYLNAPKQDRSRRSIDRAIDAAVELVAERGSDAFTLAEIATRAGVSTGSIYARVSSKTNLLRAAHEREMARISAATVAAFSEVPPQEDLPAAVARAVRTTGTILSENALVLGGFVVVAGGDPSMVAAGQAAFNQHVEGFRQQILARADEIVASDPAEATDWCFSVAFSVISRWLGLGSDPRSAGEGDWEAVLLNLSAMITAYLRSPSPR